MRFWFTKGKTDDPSSPSSFGLEPRVQKWRDYFAEQEAEQLRCFPLSDLESPLERAQYEVALNYFRKEWPTNRMSQKRVVALRADEATRRAFFDLFGKNKFHWFCLRSDGWETLLADWQGSPEMWSKVWPFSAHRHEFLDCRSSKAPQIGDRFSGEIEDFQAGSYFLRRYGFRAGKLFGAGGSDLWHWNGTALIHLPRSGSGWIS